MMILRKLMHGLVTLLFSISCWVGAQGVEIASVMRGEPQTQLWVASWGASQQIPEPRNALPAADLTDATVRQIVHLSLGGYKLRVRLSNAFGTAPLHLTAIHIAKPVSSASSKTLPESDRALTFNGAPDVTIPAGAEYISDPIDFPVAPLSDLAITFYEEQPPAQETSHPGSRATTYYTHGNLVNAEDLPGAKTIEHWYTIAGVEVAAGKQAFAIVTLGDSITDGHGATTNGNDRWPDVLAQRLQTSAQTQEVAVVNVGTGGNRLLNDGLGPNALARFDRDVLARPGVKYVIVLEGVNDLGTLHDAPSATAQPPQGQPSPAIPATATGQTADAAGQSPPTNGNAPANTSSATSTSVPPAMPQTQPPTTIHFSPATPEQHDELVNRMIAAYEQIVMRAHAADIRVIGATITPFGGSFYDHSPANDADRQKINAWILAPGHFDAVVDFAKVIADPRDPKKMAAQFDSGDHLHPSPAGYRAMGESIPLALFAGH